MPRPIARRPETDKYSRMVGVSGQIAGGQPLLPPDAPWLAGFKTELLVFPFAKHDDQADALTQLMDWTLRFRDDSSLDNCPGPIVFVHHDDGSTEIIGDSYGFFSSSSRRDPNDDRW